MQESIHTVLSIAGSQHRFFYGQLFHKMSRTRQTRKPLFIGAFFI